MKKNVNKVIKQWDFRNWTAEKEKEESKEKAEDNKLAKKRRKKDKQTNMIF